METIFPFLHSTHLKMGFLQNWTYTTAYYHESGEWGNFSLLFRLFTSFSKTKLRSRGCIQTALDPLIRYGELQEGHAT